MFKECCVCKNSRQDAILYRFPCNEIRRNLWLKYIDRDDLKNLSADQYLKLFVCQKHFEKKFLTATNTSARSRLLQKAYPSLFTEDEITSGIPSQECTENVPPQTDHLYSRQRHFDHNYCKQGELKENNASGSGTYQREAGVLNLPTSSKPDNIASISDDLNLPGPSQTAPATGHRPGASAEKVTVKGQKCIRKRLIFKMEKLSPTKKMIYQEYKKAKKQTDFYRRAKRAVKFNKEKSFEKFIENMNPYAQKIMKMQIKLCTRNKKGRRFTTEEKLIALSIMKQSPKCYRFLHKIFILPSRSTLNKMVSKLQVEPGICPQVFDLMKKEIATWKENKKMCSVIFDEMALETALTYNKNKDEINGFVQLRTKKDEFADHALVFMLRGAVYKWQQPIAYYYCQGATSGLELKNILKEVISAVKDSGLMPMSVICDQGSGFQAALKSLKEDTKRDQILANQEPDGTVTISGVNLSIIYDPSHLIKGLRNNFLNKNIMLEGKLSRWSDIVDVYKTDCDHTEARLLHKLNDEHVIPEKIKKMKVKNCVKVFSKTVSAALSYTAKFSHYADGSPVSDTLKNTADTVLFFDQLFDSVNGATTNEKKNKGKTLRKAVTEKSEHHKFWPQAIKKLENLKFVDSTGKPKSVPSINNFIITLKSYMRLWQIFTKQDIKIMRPRYFNSDPIENFFGQVRAYNYRNNDPNCHSFNCTFKSLLITRIIKFHNENFNCEDDPADQVLNLQMLFTKNVEPSHPRQELNVQNIVEQARRERLNVHSRAYSAGWVVRKIFNKTKINCHNCQQNLTSKESNIHDWVSHREYTEGKKRLYYPSEGAVRCFGIAINETNEYLEQNAHQHKISTNVRTIILSKYSFDFINCTDHKKVILDYFISLTIRFTIMNWCSIINKILKGTDIVRLQNRILPKMQKKALEKYKKKLKNKSFNK